MQLLTRILEKAGLQGKFLNQSPKIMEERKPGVKLFAKRYSIPIELRDGLVTCEWEGRLQMRPNTSLLVVPTKI